MIKVLRFIWAVSFLLFFILLFLLFYPLFWLFLLHERGYRSAHILRRVWGRTLMFLFGLYPSIRYEQPLDKKSTYIFTPNHFSYLDILSVNVQMPYYFNFMAKGELSKIPLFRLFFRTIDIPVERGSISGARKAMIMAEDRLAQGISLLNFPEGGIGSTVPKMRRFKLGAFKLAIQHKVPVVPITIIDNWKRLPANGLESGGTPGRMRVYVHRPIDTSNLKAGDEDELAMKVYRIIESKFNELNGL